MTRQEAQVTVFKILLADDPFGRKGDKRPAFRDPQTVIVAYETDAITIMVGLEEAARPWNDQDSFDGAVLGALMNILGAQRVLSHLSELLATSKKIRETLEARADAA